MKQSEMKNLLGENKIDSSASLRSAQNDKTKTINLNQTAQPTFHKNFELLAEDLKRKKRRRL